MTALIDVDRIVAEFLRERAGDRTFHPVPSTPAPCPSWCCLTPGHPYLAEHPGGLQSRYHESAVVASRDLAGGGRLEARLLADDYRTSSGRRSLTDPRIIVQGPVGDALDAMDVEQARALAGLLVEAADHLQGKRLRAA
ncbi:hypothetical protein GA0111570_10359 [Raineyella antarctica]|uniref:Uncharacterized protein n=1 Tax=Raineyella antarctica TaxID=1577474 RepID=A0A1G6GFK4_9ACTN|nr:hypothetical protein [Raineyella antarctica]SDB80740.1 hypothetical protein GA0111570_10359 [Raineyella antarctica]